MRADSKEVRASASLQRWRDHRGFLSPYFITDTENMEAVLEDPLILIYEKTINTLKDLLPLLEQFAKTHRPLLVIAEDLEGEALATLVLDKDTTTIIDGGGDRAAIE